MNFKNKIFSLMLTCYSILMFNFDSVSGMETNVSEIFLKRHSGTSFDSSKFLDNGQIYALIQAAKWSPSSFNDQPWNFIICDKIQTPEAYYKALQSIYESQRDWVENAPVLMIAVTRTRFSYNNEFNEWAEYDTGAAALSLSLQAVDLDLMTHQLGGFDVDVIRRDFSIPEDHKPMAIIAVGYETEGVDPQERERLPIGHNFFLGEWGAGFPESL